MGVPEHHCDPKNSPYIAFTQQTTTTSTTSDPSVSFVKYPNFNAPCPSFEILSNVSQSDCPVHGPPSLLTDAGQICTDIRVFVDNTTDCTKGAIVQLTCCNTASPINVLLERDNLGFCVEQETQVNLLSGKATLRYNGTCQNGVFTTIPPTTTEAPTTTAIPTTTERPITTVGPCCLELNASISGVIEPSTFTRIDDLDVNYPELRIHPEVYKRDILIVGQGDLTANGNANSGKVKGYRYMSFFNDTSAWVPFKNDIIGTAENELAGTRVAVNSKSNFLAVGQPNNLSTKQGTVRGVVISEDITAVSGVNNLRFSQLFGVSTDTVKFRYNNTDGVRVTDQTNGDKFGNALDINDGYTVIAGAPEFDDNLSNEGTTVEKVGAVAVYNFNQTEVDRSPRQIGNWLIAANAYRSTEDYSAPMDDPLRSGIYYNQFNNAKFGHSVGIDEEGTKIVVGCPGHAMPSFGDTWSRDLGAIFAYRLIQRPIDEVAKGTDGMKWEQITIDAPNGNSYQEQHGYSVAMSKDGNYIVVGAPFYGTNANPGTDGYHLGRVTVYELKRYPGRTTFEGTEIPDFYKYVVRCPKIVGRYANDKFGHDVSISENGGVILVSSLDHDGRARDVEGKGHGRVQLFKWSGSAYIQDECDIDGDTSFDQLSVVDLNQTGDKFTVGYNDKNKVENYHHTCFVPPPPPTTTQCPEDFPCPSIGPGCMTPTGGSVGEDYVNQDCEIYEMKDNDGCIVECVCVCRTTTSTTCDPQCLPTCDPNCTTTTTTCDPYCLPECDPNCTTTTTTTCDPNCLPVCAPSCTTTTVTDAPCPIDCSHCLPGPSYLKETYDEHDNRISCECVCGIEPNPPCKVGGDDAVDQFDPQDGDFPTCPNPGPCASCGDGGGGGGGFGNCPPENDPVGCTFEDGGAPISTCDIEYPPPRSPEMQEQYEDCLDIFRGELDSYNECKSTLDPNHTEYDTVACNSLIEFHGGDICGNYVFNPATCSLKLTYTCEVQEWDNEGVSGTRCVCTETDAEWVRCKECNHTGDIFSCDSNVSICTITAEGAKDCGDLGRNGSVVGGSSEMPKEEDNPLP